MSHRGTGIGVLTALLVLALVSPGFAVVWQKTIGGSGTDVAYSVAQTRDSGYIVVGYTSSRGAGKKDVWLVKTNALGDTLWTRTYGGANDDIGWSVAQTRDGGYVIAGETYSFGAGFNDLYIIKTDAVGNPTWSKFYGSYAFEAGYSVAETQADGYIVGGYTLATGSAQGYLVRVSASGDSLWTTAYGTGNGDYAYCVRQTSDGAFIATGSHEAPSGHTEISLARVNQAGDLVWVQGHLSSDNSAGRSVEPASGGYLVTGFSGPIGNEDIKLFKTDTAGQTSTYYTYQGPGTDMAFDARLLPDNGCIIAGKTNSFGAGGSDAYMIRVNSAYDSLWTHTYGGPRDDQGNSVSPTFDGGFIIAGSTRSFGVESTDVFLIKTDANGITGLEQEPAGNLLPKPRRPALEVVPNPFVACARVRGHEQENVALYDVSSRKVGEFRGDRIGDGLPAGVYFVQLEGQPDTPQRVVKLR
jgi:hypothetical protein